MSEENFYRCIPELNKECKKTNCFINGGECENTIHKEYTLKGLLEEIERLNNIITELLKWLEKERKLDFNNKQCIEAILDKLKELKEINFYDKNM